MRPLSRSDAILVVDDDRDIREVLADYLREEGYDVMTADNGRDALDQVARRKFVAILMDLWMPVMDGRAMWVALRRDGNTTPLILMTADLNGRRTARELGVACLVKPFSINSLLATMELLSPSPPRHSVIPNPFVPRQQPRYLT